MKAIEDSRLALDVSLETARALHRVWRALNDGDCPACHTYHQATQMHRTWINFHRKEVHGIMCPTCRFKVTRVEIEAIEKMFAPAMDAAVQIFRDWQNSREHAATSSERSNGNNVDNPNQNA